MAELAAKIPGIPSGAPTPAPVAGVTIPEAPKLASPVHPGQSPPQSVVEYGGNRGGRPRTDGLVPGSEEALAADRERARQKKANYRAKLRAENPPVLPSVLPGAPTASPNQVATPDNGQAVGPGVESSPDFQAWTPDDLKDIFEEIIPATEQEMVASLTRKAAKAKLPPALLRDIEADSRWSPTTKKALTMGLSGTGVKYLNQFGISAKYKPETILLAAITRVTFSHLRLSRKLDQLIAQREKEGEKAPEPPKPEVKKV